jgi:hypothetical protein
MTSGTTLHREQRTDREQRTENVYHSMNINAKLRHGSQSKSKENGKSCYSTGSLACQAGTHKQSKTKLNIPKHWELKLARLEIHKNEGNKMKSLHRTGSTSLPVGSSRGHKPLHSDLWLPGCCDVCQRAGLSISESCCGCLLSHTQNCNVGCSPIPPADATADVLGLGRV